MARLAPHFVLNSGGTTVNQVLYEYRAVLRGVVASRENNTGPLFFQIHDSATIPADGAVPMFSLPISTTGIEINVSGGFNFPVYMENGIYVCLSDTFATKTLSSTSDMFVTILVEEDVDWRVKLEG